MIDAVLVSWLDGTVMNVGRSSSSRAQLEIVHTLLVIVILTVLVLNLYMEKIIKIELGL